jgi:hypothetical protein
VTDVERKNEEIWFRFVFVPPNFLFGFLACLASLHSPFFFNLKNHHASGLAPEGHSRAVRAQGGHDDELYVVVQTSNKYKEVEFPVSLMFHQSQERK